jgi:hypothetical protein
MNLSIIIILIPFICILGLSLFFNRKQAEKKWVQGFTKPKIIFLILITWSVLGFLTNHDYTQQWGDFIIHEPIFSLQNVFYCGITLLLLLIAYLIPVKPIKVSILSIELLYWLYKLFIIKGGYAVGIGGVPSMSILTFDLIAFILRLQLIKLIISPKFNSLYLLIPAFVIMILKVAFFPTQQSIKSEFKKYSKDLESRKNQMLGKWRGISTITLIKNDSTIRNNFPIPIEKESSFITDTVQLEIDSNLIQI